MKKLVSFLTILFFAITVFAKNEVTTSFSVEPALQCQNCENKIKSNLRFEKGIKDISTSIENNRVTIKYDADKTTPAKIIEGFQKIGYTATAADACNKANNGTCNKKSNGSCCKKSEGKCSEQVDGATGATQKVDGTTGATQKAENSECKEQCSKDGQKKDGKCCKETKTTQLKKSKKSTDTKKDDCCK